MWIPNSLIAEVDAVARVKYIGWEDCERWNSKREPGQLRLMTGWCWEERRGRRYRQNIKSKTAAYIEAATVLLEMQAPRPTMRLRVVAGRNAA